MHQGLVLSSQSCISCFTLRSFYFYGIKFTTFASAVSHCCRCQLCSFPSQMPQFLSLKREMRCRSHVTRASTSHVRSWHPLLKQTGHRDDIIIVPSPRTALPSLSGGQGGDGRLGSHLRGPGPFCCGLTTVLPGLEEGVTQKEVCVSFPHRPVSLWLHHCCPTPDSDSQSCPGPGPH